MLAAILVMLGLGLVLGLVLGYAALKFKVEGDPLVEKIDAILPQTQCGQCGYPGCKPYATAIAKGEADINQCPPGGDAGVRALADLLGREYKPLNAEHGQPKPKSVAVIDENLCIGCTLCIQACPVDAILGAAALGDIGRLFPDHDPTFRDADSRALLRTAVARAAAAGWRVGNVDATVIAERPRIGPHVAAMCAAAEPDVVLGDFETLDYGNWKATGEAFGPGMEPYIRLAFGNIRESEIPEAVARFREVPV